MGLSKSGLKDHFWTVPKVVLKTTFGQSQRWSLSRCTLGVEDEGKNNLNFANKVFNRQDVLILGGLNSGISLYIVLKIAVSDTYLGTIYNMHTIYKTTGQNTGNISN